MKDLIASLLNRELNKLERLSSSSSVPLSPADIRSLDLLTKAYRTFVDPAPTVPAASAAADPAKVSTEELLDGLAKGDPA